MEEVKNRLTGFYYTMFKIRQFEDAVNTLYKTNFIPGFSHLYIGEEAVATGVCANLRDGDYITSTHRGHGHLIAKGGDLRRMMAEILGKETGYCRGKGGTMHITDINIGILGANGIVGAGIPVATGAGLSIKVRKTDQVVVCFFGDGASNQGAFHEGINLGSLWKLPVIYICENNLYGESVRQDRHQNIRDIASRAAAYNIPGVAIDGNDVEVVYETVGEAVKRARAGDGPSLIECKTYRWGGHHVGDPGTAYRTPEEIQMWKERCPIKRLKEKLLTSGISTEKEIAELEENVQAEVEEAVQFAKDSPLPQPEEALEDIFV